MRRTIGLVTLFMAATAALAHQGVKDPAVKARMVAMGDIAAAAKVLSDMAKGTAPFDMAEAQNAARRIAAEAERVPALFETPADDPKSEALPAIWDSFDAFTGISMEMKAAAEAAAAGIASRDDLGPALRSIGAACRDCHEDFRE